MLPSLESLVFLFTRHNIMGFYYAVAKGRSPGIYRTWDECKAQVHKFPGPVYKKFPSSQEAQAFIDGHTCLPNKSSVPLSSSTNLIHTRASPPEDMVAIGRKGKEGTSKRVWASNETEENVTVAVSKRSKTFASSAGPSNNSNNSKKEKKHFDMDSDGFVNVYTDGACSSNGYRGAKAGVGAYFGDDSPLNVSEPVVGRATNNMAEIQAVTRAAERAQEAGITKLRINTDSEFLIKSATQWMPRWKARGWQTAANKPVINRQELQEMEAALEPLTVEWNHVRGHRGIYGNEMADKLAREGAERYRGQE